MPAVARKCQPRRKSSQAASPREKVVVSGRRARKANQRDQGWRGVDETGALTAGDVRDMGVSEAGVMDL